METIRFIVMPIFVAAAATTASSFLWYGIFLAKGNRTVREEASAGTVPGGLKNISRVSFLAHVLSAMAIYMLVDMFRIGAFSQGLRMVFAVWFFVAAMAGLKKVVFGNKSLENFILGAGHDFVNVAVASAILVALSKY